MYSWDDIAARIEMYRSIIEEFHLHLSDANRQLGYSVGGVQDSLEKIETHLLRPSETAATLLNRAQVIKYFLEASNGLLSLPRMLHSNNTCIERDQEDDITIQFEADLSSS